MDVEKAKKKFRSIISSVLGGPGGDPEPCNHEAAAAAVAGLVALGEKVEDIQAYQDLKDPNRNLYGCDFMADHGL